MPTPSLYAAKVAEVDRLRAQRDALVSEAARLRAQRDALRDVARMVDATVGGRLDDVDPALRDRLRAAIAAGGQ